MSEQPTGGRREFELDLVSEGVRRYWYLILLNAVIMSAVAFAITSQLPKRYATYAQVELAETPISTVFGFPSTVDTDRNLQNQIRIATGEKVYALAAAALGHYPRIGVYSAGPNNMLNFVATSSTAAGAQNDSNQFVAAYMKVAEARFKSNFTVSIAAIQKQSATLRKRIAALPANDPTATQLRSALSDLESQQNRLETAAQVATSPVSIVFSAPLPVAPDEPKPKRVASIAFVLSMLPATALAAMLARYRRGLVDVAALVRTPDLVTVEVPSALNGKSRRARLSAAADEMAIEIDALGPRVGGALAAFIVLVPSTRTGRAVAAVASSLQRHRGDVALFTLSATNRSDGLPATATRWGVEKEDVRRDLEELERSGGSAVLYARFDVGGDALRACEYASSRVVVIERNRMSKALFERRLRQLDTLGLKIDAVLVA